MGHPMAKNGIRKRGEKFFKHQNRRFDKMEEPSKRNIRLDEDEDDGFNEFVDDLDTM